MIEQCAGVLLCFYNCLQMNQVTACIKGKAPLPRKGLSLQSAQIDHASIPLAKGHHGFEIEIQLTRLAGLATGAVKENGPSAPLFQIPLPNGQDGERIGIS